MAICHFHNDDDWGIQSECRQSYFLELKLVTDKHPLQSQLHSVIKLEIEKLFADINLHPIVTFNSPF